MSVSPYKTETAESSNTKSSDALGSDAPDQFAATFQKFGPLAAVISVTVAVPLVALAVIVCGTPDATAVSCKPTSVLDSIRCAAISSACSGSGDASHAAINPSMIVARLEVVEV